MAGNRMGRKLRRQTLDELRAEVTVTSWLTLVYFEQVADQEAVLAKAEAIEARLAQSRDGDPRGEDMALLLRTLRRRLEQLDMRVRRSADDGATIQ